MNTQHITHTARHENTKLNTPNDRSLAAAFGPAWDNPATRDAILVDYLKHSVMLPAAAMQRPDTDVRKFVKVTGTEAALRLEQAKEQGWHICGTLSPASIKHCREVLISLREFSVPTAENCAPDQATVRYRVLAYKMYSQPSTTANPSALSNAAYQGYQTHQ